MRSDYEYKPSAKPAGIFSFLILSAVATERLFALLLCITVDSRKSLKKRKGD